MTILLATYAASMALVAIAATIVVVGERQL